MEIKIIKNNEGIKRKINEYYKVTNLLTKENSEKVSFAIGDAKNHYETTKNIKSDRIYYVLEGKIIVKKENKEFVAEKGDLIFIPKNTEYHFEGTFETILINSPAFDIKDEKIKELKK